MTHPQYSSATEIALRLLQASSCFRPGAACGSLPCACAQSLVDALSPQAQAGCTCPFDGCAPCPVCAAQAGGAAQQELEPFAWRWQKPFGDVGEWQITKEKPTHAFRMLEPLYVGVAQGQSDRGELADWQYRFREPHNGAPWGPWKRMMGSIEENRALFAGRIMGEPNRDETKMAVEFRPLYAVSSTNRGDEA